MRLRTLVYLAIRRGILGKMESDLGKLFIGGISWDTDEDRLKEHFRAYGEILEAVIMRDRTTGRAHGFGFIVFADPVVAEMVVMEKHMIDGRNVEAKKAVPRDDNQMINKNNICIQGSSGPAGCTKKIFVGGLASTVTESDFKNYFDQFGTIMDVVVMYDHNTQRPRGFGFVTYDSEEAVDWVLHRTFHKLNGKMVEVKRAVPKELSPGPNRTPLVGYNNGFSQPNSFLSSYSQAYNLSSVGRFNPVPSARTRFSPFGSPGYGMGVNLEPGLNPSFGGSTNFNNNLGYGRNVSPFYGSSSSSYTTPIGYSGVNGQSDSVLSSPSRNLLANGGLNTSARTTGTGSLLGSGYWSFGVFGNSGVDWGSFPISTQAIESSSGYSNIGSSNGENSSGLGLGITTSSFGAPTRGFEVSYADLNRGGSVCNDPNWKSISFVLDGSNTFGHGLGNEAFKNSENYSIAS
ncbi:hypothetical protein LguiA_035681 [Lonicera macranthoides]